MIFDTLLAEENWRTKYKYGDERPLDTFVRVAREVAEVESKYGASEGEIEEKFEEFLHTLVKLEKDAEADPSEEDVIELSDGVYRATGLNATPGGRITANAGTNYDETTLWNCLHGDEEVITREGPEKISKLSGSSHDLLTQNGWVESEVRSFGRSSFQKVVLKPCIKTSIDHLPNSKSSCFQGVQSNLEIEVVATSDHRWIKPDGTETEDISVGDNIKSNTVDVEDDVENTSEYKEAFRHGLVFGDGYVNNRHPDGTVTFGVRLCTNLKSSYTELFDNVTYPSSYGGDPFCSIKKTSKNYKEVPDSKDPTYIRGFIDGWDAADGHTYDAGNFKIFSQDSKAIEWLKEYAVYGGYLPIGCHESDNMETQFGERSSSLEGVMLTEKSKYEWEVVSIEERYDRGESYCAVVEEENAFTLSGGVYTGNCFVAGPVSDATIEYDRPVSNSEESIEVSLESEQTPDNLTNIFLSLLEAAETLKSEGGYGVNFGFIRPRGTLIEGVGIRHPGVVSYMEMWDKMSEIIVKGDNDGYEDELTDHLEDPEDTANKLEKAMPRKGAMLAALPVWHPDIEEYIRSKQQAGRLTKFNISVLIDDKFMRAVENDDFYELHFDGKVHKKVKARELYDLIMESTYSRNEPGILYLDNANRYNPILYLGPNTASNPCGEVTGSSYMNKHYNPDPYLEEYLDDEEHHLGFTTVCLLGSINLTQFVNEDRTFDWDAYKETISTFARMLENVNDIDMAPLPAYRWAIEKIRQYGMGINGLGSTLYMLGKKYGSDEAVAFTEKVNALKDELTMRESALLAKERGPFPMYDERYLETPYFQEHCKASEETKELVREYGIRNAKRLTNPPLGSSSVICDNVSNGIEPVFNHEYERTVIADEWPEGLNRDNVEDKLDKIQVGDATAWRGEYNGKVWYWEPHNRGICFIETVRDYGYDWVKEHYPEDIEEDADYLETSDTLNIDDHVRMQKVVQDHLDQSCSKTANLPNDYPFEDFKSLYKDAWEAGLVGFTTYRAGTMETVLDSTEEQESDEDEFSSLLDLYVDRGCVPPDVSTTEDGVIVRDINLPDEFSNGKTRKVRADGNKYYIHLSYLPGDDQFPVAFWVHSNELQDKEYVSLNRAVKSVTKLLINMGVDMDIVLDYRDKISEDAHHSRLGKMISMALRHNVGLPNIVSSIQDIEGDYIASTLTAVRKFLKEKIEDGTEVRGATCESCGSENIVFESGCDKCLDCGASSCS